MRYGERGIENFFEDQTEEEGQVVTQIEDMVRHAIIGKDKIYERSFAN